MRGLKSRKQLVWAILLALTGTVVAEALVFQAAYARWLSRAGVSGCACGGLTGRFGPVDWIVSGLAGMFLTGLLVGAIALTITWWRTRKLSRELLQVNPVRYETAELALFNGDRCEAFTLGLWHPRIVVCQHCVKTCAPAELSAMVGHEAQHVRRRDPLKFLALDVLKYTYFFLPIFWSFAAMYRTIAELEADAQVVDRQALGQALLRVATAQPTLGLASFASVLGQRIERLVNPNWRLRLPFSPTLAIISAGFLVAVFLSLQHTPKGTAPLSSSSCPMTVRAAPCQSAPRYGLMSVTTLF